jgi:phospholipid/cholesterol/gamma-HCH transport system substrate-binding protein
VPEVADALLRVANHADRILDQVDRAKLPEAAAATLAELDRTLADARTTLDRADVAGLSRQARADLADLDGAVKHADALLGKIDGKGGLLASAQRTTTAFGDLANGPIGEELLSTLREVQEAAASFRRLSDAIERDPSMLVKGRTE